MENLRHFGPECSDGRGAWSWASTNSFTVQIDHPARGRKVVKARSKDHAASSSRPHFCKECVRKGWRDGKSLLRSGRPCPTYKNKAISSSGFVPPWLPCEGAECGPSRGGLSDGRSANELRGWPKLTKIKSRGLVCLTISDFGSVSYDVTGHNRPNHTAIHITITEGISPRKTRIAFFQYGTFATAALAARHREALKFSVASDPLHNGKAHLLPYRSR